MKYAVLSLALMFVGCDEAPSTEGASSTIVDGFKSITADRYKSITIDGKTILIDKEDSMLILKKQFYDSIKSPNLYDSLLKQQGAWTILFDGNWKETNDLKEFTYYRRLTYKNGIKTDDEIDFNSNGDIIAKRSYYKGKLHGQVTDYYDNGNIKSKYNYYHGNLSGKQVEYWADGKIYSKENYSNGKLSGYYALYFGNGKPKQVGSYSKGEKSGTWYYYDYDGEYKQTQFMQVRVGAICNDGWESSATGRGACSHHGGVNYWLVDTREIVIGGTGKHQLKNGYYEKYF